MNSSSVDIGLWLPS